MAKKPKLVDLVKNLPKVKHGSTFRDRLDENQAKDFDELLAWLRSTNKGNWPSFVELKKAMEATIGVSCSQGTLRREVEGR